MTYKHFLFVLFSVSIISSSFAQLKQHKTYYDNGKVEEEGQYKNDKTHGTWKYYYNDGQLYAIENYDEGVKVGEWVSYYENGQLETKANYVNGVPNGLALAYFEDGSLQGRATIINGVLEGDYIAYEDVDKIREKGTYKDGEKVGLWIENKYYSNGNFKEEAQYLDGKKHGSHKKYFENGQIALIANYKNDIADGPYKEYNKDGTLSETGEALKGERHGVIKEYRYGELSELTTYNNGQKEGRYEDWNIDKNQLKEEGFYKNDEKSGYWKLYDSYGNIEEEGPYKKDEKNGYWKIYLTNHHSKKHKIYSEGNYVNGERDGKWIFYNENEEQEYYTIYKKGDEVEEVKDGIEYISKYDATSDSYYTEGEKHYKNNKLIKTIKYIIKGNTIVDKEVWVNGKLESKASEGYEKRIDYYKIYFKNKCNNKVQVALRILDMKTDNWTTKAWFNLQTNEEGYLADTKNAIFYYYAEDSTGSYWGGEHRKNVDGRQFGFKKIDMSSNGKGKYFITLTCD
jgi:antitoxin component YwqK of YwqJK toxin-antitoxin module